MNLTQAQRHMRSLMAQHGLTGWTFGWDRAVSRRGVCIHSRRQITMSRRLTELATEDEAEQTMLHEIAHALVGPSHGHDATWLRQARAIGFRGGRTSKRAQTVPPKYIATCPGCGRKSGRHKRQQRGHQHSCAACSGGRFNARFILEYLPNTTGASV